MFYKMIETARNNWLASPECTVKNIIDYIVKTNKLRDAQIDAIKTYLYLKIGCNNKPLSVLFTEGAFNTINIDDLEISVHTRDYLYNNPSALALLQYAMQKNDNGGQVSEKLENQIKKEPSSIKYKEIFNKAFYGVSYTDYLFSLPMGAGKTYLMAAFIYLDLYFAAQEPNNPAFAHNFVIFAPSGLKASVVPSLRTIQRFDPSWIIAEPAATEIKKKIIFEVLEQNSSAKKSNKTKNPNVQKIANHQPLSDLFGLVAVTNAEKVILDRIQEKNGQISFLEESYDDKDRQANELRNLIGKLPALSVFIDEVHHAVKDEIKLRAVVSKWAENGSVNSVVGFSGTPYLEKAEKIEINSSLSVATAEITNIVYYYPLIKGVGNFLKQPVVKIASMPDSLQIIDKGVREFLDNYRDTVYEGGLTAKLGIYCGTIEKLEQTVYPLVARIVTEYKMPVDCILKFHKGNKLYPQPADSPMQFEMLDKDISKIRIILLVQIGKEGWDCRSLTGIILSQEGDCPKNMVLQTSCRCLRQVVRNRLETAIIYLNEDNAEKLNLQLQQQHHITLKEFENADNKPHTIKRYDRTQYLKLPPIKYYQLKISYETIIIDKETDIKEEIQQSVRNSEQEISVKITNLEMKNILRETLDDEYGNIPVTFTEWVYLIVKESFGFLSMKQLKEYEDVLQKVFDEITFYNKGTRCYSSKFKQAEIRADIRKAFCEKRTFSSKEELIPDEAALLKISNFTDTIKVDSTDKYYPEQELAEKIILDDKGKLKMDPKLAEILRLAEETNQKNIIDSIKNQLSSHPQKNRSFHYMPYHLDSGFELEYFKEILSYSEIERLNLEVYYNGDRALTEFKIRCYSHDGNEWKYIGMYTPDFLIIQRKNSVIYKAIIIETKGEIYSYDPKFRDKRSFMETEFLSQNNKEFGYERFQYLYLEDTLTENERTSITCRCIRNFFEEETSNAN